MKIDQRIVAHEIEQSLGAADKTGNQATGSDDLLTIGDGSAIDEVEDLIGKHFGVHTELELVGQAGQGSPGDAADTHLQGGAVFDEVGDVLADASFDFGFEGSRVFEQRSVGMNPAMNTIRAHDVGPKGAGHLLVELRDHDFGGFSRGFGGVTGCTE